MLVMGCGGSKADEAALVVLCRERKQYMKAATEYRNSLAASHVAYFHSLGSVGEAILKFAEEELALESPVLHLPSREGKLSSSSPSTPFSHSLEESSSALHRKDKKNKRPRPFFVDTDEDVGIGINEDGTGSHLRLSSSEDGFGSDRAPSRGERGVDEVEIGYGNNNATYDSHGGYWGPDHGNFFQPRQNDLQPPGRIWDYFNPEPSNISPYPYPSNYPGLHHGQPVYGHANFNAYYMRKTPTHSRTVVFEDPSTRVYSGSGFYVGESSGGYNNSGYFRYPSQAAEATPEKKPPPAPPSPKASTWDFFNLFDGIDGGSNGYYSEHYPNSRYGYGSTTSSPDSKEVREREGIPDLEDDREDEIMKAVNHDKEYGPFDVNKTKKKRTSEEGVINEQERSVFANEASTSIGEGPSKQGQTPGSGGWGNSEKGIVGSPEARRSPVSITSLSPEEEEEISQFVNKKGVTFDVEGAGAVDVDPSTLSSLSTLSYNGTRDLKEAAIEIKKEFESASGYGKEVAIMLEVGKLPYYRRTTLLKAIYSRILYLFSSQSLPKTVSNSSKTAKIARAYSGEPSPDIDLDKKCLSSTIQQLYAWEKKLYKEVKDEERLRIEYDKLCRRLEKLDKHGAEPGKINATQSAIRTLLTKIDICVHAVTAISSKITSLRDEELHPQIIQLIYGYTRMWEAMMKCHQKQVQAMRESKARYLLAISPGDSDLKATIDLENEIMSWCSLFNKWISSQKSYFQTLNQWLSRCLVSEPEETADGPAPFSPGRIGAPPIFVICNDWNQAMTVISNKIVENTMLNFASTLHHLWERQDEQRRQLSKADSLRRKNIEKRLQKMRMGSVSHETLAAVATENGHSPLNGSQDEMVAVRKKLQSERAKQRAVSNTVQAGLVPIFEALGNFAADALKAHEQVRLHYTGA